MKNSYDLSNAEFVKILQEMRGRGTPITTRVSQLGLLYLINDGTRDIYQIVYMTHDNTAFVAEYIHHFELLEFITGDAKGLLSCFPFLKMTKRE